MNKNLNLLEKFKNVPAGTKFFTTTRGDCEFCRIDETSIIVKIYDYCTYIYRLDKFGRLGKDGECIIFPSKDQRDWSKFEYDPIAIGTPVMVNWFDDWVLRFYAGKGRCCKYQRPFSKALIEMGTIKGKETIPVSEFDFEKFCKK